MYIEIGITSDSSEEMVEQLKRKGYTLISGKFPYGVWEYNGKNDKINPNKKIIKYNSYGTETNEVGEVFIELKMIE